MRAGDLIKKQRGKKGRDRRSQHHATEQEQKRRQQFQGRVHRPVAQHGQPGQGIFPQRQADGEQEQREQQRLGDDPGKGGVEYQPRGAAQACEHCIRPVRALLIAPFGDCMTQKYDVAGLGNAIMDVIAAVDDQFLLTHGIAKGAMTLIDEFRAQELHKALAHSVQAAGGSAANTMAGIASLGGRAVFLGKVCDDVLGARFGESLKSLGRPLSDGARLRRIAHRLVHDRGDA